MRGSETALEDGIGWPRASAAQLDQYGALVQPAATPVRGAWRRVERMAYGETERA